MFYNQTQIQGNSMPLLMGFTEPIKIEFDDIPGVSYYDPISQIKQIESRYVGTRCLKVSGTVKRNSGGGRYQTTDKKNEIDDQKFVK